MSWSPEVIGIGPYTKKIRDEGDIPYPPENYEHAEEGLEICGTLQSWGTKGAAMEFLEDVLGMDWLTMSRTMDWRLVDVTEDMIADVQTYKVLINLSRLPTVETLLTFRRLQLAGWKLFFDPNC